MNTFKIRLDPHVHSEGSYDSESSIDAILDQANYIDIDAVAVTDHNNIEKSLDAVKLAEKYPEVIAIPGVEVSTAAGHLLALGVEERPKRGMPFQETVEKVRELGGIAVVPHPFQSSRHGVRRSKIKDVDGVEVYNAWLFTGVQNRRARNFAVTRDYPEYAGSDAHTVGMVGRAYVEFEIETEKSRDELDKDDIVEALREGDTGIKGHKAPIHKTAINYFFYAVNKTLLKLRDAAIGFVDLFNTGFEPKILELQELTEEWADMLPRSPLDMNLKIAEIVDAEDFDEAKHENILRLMLSFEDEEKTSFAQLGETYEPEELVGKKVLCATNLGNLNISGRKSDVIVMNIADDNNKPVLVVPDSKL